MNKYKWLVYLIVMALMTITLIAVGGTRGDYLAFVSIIVILLASFGAALIAASDD